MNNTQIDKEAKMHRGTAEQIWLCRMEVELSSSLLASCRATRRVSACVCVCLCQTCLCALLVECVLMLIFVALITCIKAWTGTKEAVVGL